MLYGHMPERCDDEESRPRKSRALTGTATISEHLARGRPFTPKERRRGAGAARSDCPWPEHTGQLVFLVHHIGLLVATVASDTVTY